MSTQKSRVAENVTETTREAAQTEYLRSCIRSILVAQPDVAMDVGEILSGSSYFSAKRDLRSVAARAGVVLPLEPAAAQLPPPARAASSKQLSYVKSLRRQVIQLGGSVTERMPVSSSEASTAISALLSAKNRLSRMSKAS